MTPKIITCFDKTSGRLVFIKEKATPHFWDILWSDGHLKTIISNGRKDRFVSKVTKKFIRPSMARKVLEGGCGRGQFVYSLKHSGYDAYGIDFAESTVRKINMAMPSLNVSIGDVRNLSFQNDFFDGYWSLGVIEHFFEGYDAIIREMNRVIKPGGYLFLTFPYMSPLRKIKSHLGLYPPIEGYADKLSAFYQFALNHQAVIADLEIFGFSLELKRPLDGIKGMKDEIAPIAPFIRFIYQSKLLPIKMLAAGLSFISAPFCGHSILLVLKKNA